MRAVRSTPPGVTVVDQDVPDVPDDGELIAIRSAGICASDLKYIGFGCTNILGHELAGTTQDGTPVAVAVGRGWGDRTSHGRRGPADGCGAGEPGSALPPSTAGWRTARRTNSRHVYDVVIDAAGSGSALGRATELARPGGTIVVLGVYGPDTVWPQHQCFLKELRVVPSLGYCRHGDRRDFDDAANMLAQRPELTESLITHRFPIEDAAEAFRVASDKSSGALRVVLEP